ncbi:MULTISPECIES: hypothetical protein [Cobetia]|uniref:hypothetical protein n=1 Tax=Cobetia TaxID=204286 RepID=UPI000985FA6A|nr:MULTISPECIES: hypothetical protein [Cobetia]POR06590.1 hypothetical protein BOH68_11015 [Cobetia sp. MM1IDA2H-1]
MDLLDLVEKNIFLNKLFKDGITKSVKIAKLDLAKDGRSEMNVHITQEPSIEVKKWGVWGKHYNTINLVLSGGSVVDVEVKNWDKLVFCDLMIKKEGNLFYLSQEDENSHIRLSCDGFLFKEIRVHWNDEA